MISYATAIWILCAIFPLPPYYTESPNGSLEFVLQYKISK